MIWVEDLVKRYRKAKQNTVDGISFAVEAGEEHEGRCRPPLLRRRYSPSSASTRRRALTEPFAA